MSNKIDKPAKRPYRKRRRAELEDETRLRITKAAADLHELDGPAKTTISAVADRAGVQRATLYRHFPDERALFEACSSHWMARHPLPDLAGWSAIDDPDQRVKAALEELYSWYARGESMVENVTRDATLVPAMRGPVSQFEGWFEVAADTLVRGRGLRGVRRRRVRAAAGHAISFATWRSLLREQGLAEPEAVELMSRLIATASD